MRLSITNFVLLAVAMPCSGSDDETSKTSALRGNGHRVLRPQYPCTILRVETQYEEGAAEFLSSAEPQDEFKCALHPSDRELAGRHFVDIKGVDTAMLFNVTSGETTMEVQGAIIANGAYTVPAGAAIQFGKKETRRRLSKTEGQKKILVIRASTNGGSTISQRSSIVDAIFGTYGNTVSMRSQYLGCSHDKLDFAPFEGTTQYGYNVQDGILEVSINDDFTGQTRYEAEEGLQKAAEALVGDLESQFDHVMLCLPPGTAGSWVAYAYVNSYIAAFNDQWCEKLSTIFHEIGHNLNLAHSGTIEGPYYDKHGMMGFSYDQFFGPKMCFNPAKSWQLGWYEDQSVEWDPNLGTFVGTLVGVVDYGRNYNDFVVVKIQDSWSRNIFIGYNRAKGFNGGTKMASNMVTFVEAGDGYSQSTYIAGLSAGESYTFSSFGSYEMPLTIHFLGTGSSEDEANIAISYGDCVFPTCCEGAMCMESMILPTPPPTPSPTPNPTPTPVPGATPSANPFQGTGTPQVLLIEDFSNNLGSFSALGERIIRRTEDQMAAAKFEFKDANMPPRLEAEIDVNGSTIISVFFWFKATSFRDDESVVIRFSVDGKQSWSRARVIQFGYDAEFQVDVWYRMKDAFFTIPEGTQSMTLQIFGQTGQNEASNSLLVLDDATTISEFYLGGFQCMGDRSAGT